MSADSEKSREELLEEVAELRRQAAEKSDEALRESERRYRMLFNGMLDGFALHEIICDASGKPCDYRFLEVNPAFEKLTGLTPEQTIGRTVREALPDIEDFWIEVYGEVALTGIAVRFEHYIRALDKHFDVSAFSPRPGQFATLFIDITKRKRAEEELEQYHGHLEELVRERSRDLEAAQDELVRGERLSMLGRLTATVSHELRNPLGVIRATVYFLQQKLGESDGNIGSHLQRIETQVERCDAIVGELLEYTRGRRSETQPGEINSWLVETLKEIPDLKRVAVDCDLPTQRLTARFDKERMRRVVINLAHNAVQATADRQRNAEPGGFEPRVKVSAAAVEGRVRIAVEDNGVGMDEKTVAQAFEPLFTTRPRGTGLGLAIVRKIVEEHNGTVWLQSQPNQGTKVIVDLPADPR